MLPEKSINEYESCYDIARRLQQHPDWNWTEGSGSLVKYPDNPGYYLNGRLVEKVKNTGNGHHDDYEMVWMPFDRSFGGKDGELILNLRDWGTVGFLLEKLLKLQPACFDAAFSRNAYFVYWHDEDSQLIRFEHKDPGAVLALALLEVLDEKV